MYMLYVLLSSHVLQDFGADGAAITQLWYSVHFVELLGCALGFIPAIGNHQGL